MELVFVTLALSILMVSVAPNFRTAMRGLELERAAFETAQTLRSARVVAISQGEPVVWQWDARQKRMQLAALHEQEDGTVEQAHLEGRVGRPRTMPVAVEMTVVRDDEVVDAITFLPDGTSDSTRVLFGDPDEPRYTIDVQGTTSQIVLR